MSLSKVNEEIVVYSCVLKGKLKHIKKSKVVRSAPQTRARGKVFIQKTWLIFLKSPFYPMICGTLCLFKKFYWGIVDLQCCVSFRCTAK